MNGGRRQGVAFVQLSDKGYSKCYLAAAKHGADIDTESMKTFAEYADGKRSEDFEDRHLLDSEELCEIAYLSQLHAEMRIGRGNESAAKGYMAAGKRLENQLVKQGEWEEPGVKRDSAIEKYNGDYLEE